MAFGISDLLCGGFDSLSRMIRLGTFDRVLTRPVGTFTQVLASDLQIRRLGAHRAGCGGAAAGALLAGHHLDVAEGAGVDPGRRVRDRHLRGNLGHRRGHHVLDGRRPK